MATLRAAGVLEAARQFPNELDLNAVRELRVGQFQPRVEWAELARELDGGQDPELREAILHVLDRPGRPYPGAPPRPDTPDFRTRHSALIVSLTRDRVSWPPPEPFAAPPGVGLVRAVDAPGGRHVYGIGRVPPGELAGELGRLPREAARGMEPLWMTAGGYLVTDSAGAPPPRASTPASLRWALAPLAWRDAGDPLGRRARAAFARAMAVIRRPPERSAAPVAVVAHIHRDVQPGRLPLHSAFHPVTGDQLLATTELEAIDMGYGRPTLIGYVDASAPVTGTLETARPGVPWASRFGQRLRRA